MFASSYHYGRDGAALHAMSAIDMALWDLLGKVSGLSVAQLLGGQTSSEIEIYASEVMPDTPAEVTALATRVVEEGFGALKLGWGPLGQDVGRDVELAEAARAVLGPDRKLMIDGGMAYSLRSAREFCRRVEDLQHLLVRRALRGRRSLLLRASHWERRGARRLRRGALDDGPLSPPHRGRRQHLAARLGALRRNDHGTRYRGHGA